MTITEAERKEINPYATSSQPLTSAGIVKLNGEQAGNFSRIHHIDSDFERTRRQRDVLSALYIGFKQASAVSKTQMIKKGLSDIITNMTAAEITSLGMDVLPTMANEIQQLRLPLDGYYTVISSSVWYMIVNYNRMIPKVYEFIYGATQPFDPVPTIPSEASKPSTSSKSSSVSSSLTNTSSSVASSVSSSSEEPTVTDSSSSASEAPTATDTPPASSSTLASESDSAS